MTHDRGRAGKVRAYVTPLPFGTMTRIVVLAPFVRHPLLAEFAGLFFSFGRVGLPGSPGAFIVPDFSGKGLCGRFCVRAVLLVLCGLVAQDPPYHHD